MAATSARSTGARHVGQRRWWRRCRHMQVLQRAWPQGWASSGRCSAPWHTTHTPPTPPPPPLPPPMLRACSPSMLIRCDLAAAPHIAPMRWRDWKTELAQSTGAPLPRRDLRCPAADELSGWALAAKQYFLKCHHPTYHYHRMAHATVPARLGCPSSIRYRNDHPCPELRLPSVIQSLSSLQQSLLILLSKSALRLLSAK